MKTVVSVVITSLVLTILLLRFQLLLDHPLLLFAFLLVGPRLLDRSVDWLWTRLLGSAQKPDKGEPRC
jgi:hypothetical protein